jgi:hypothetical protein
MDKFMRLIGSALLAAVCAATVSCGGSAPGSGGTTTTTTVTPASNVLAVSVSGGPAGLAGPAVNTLYTTVTVCVPGSTTECQSIDNVQVDTQSYGLRILASVLTLSLPVTTDSGGNALVECTQFVDGYSWGPVASADLQITGETASSVPIQVIGSSNFTVVPAACSSTGSAEDTVAEFGANGILGIGNFAQDCGEYCATTVDNGDYYACTASACAPSAVPLTSQVSNPVPLFAVDNNGTIIDLPAVAESGAATVTGSLIFGIDTESNNVSGSETVLAVQGSTDDSPGDFTTVFNGASLVDSFIDSGSNGLFFNDSAIAACTSSDFTGFYCPASAVGLSATLTGVNNLSTTVDFTIDNAQTQADANSTFTAFATLGGTFSSSTTSFDWGLPFFYGRRVANAMEGVTTTVGTGPYVAF